jgi:hypothetical protein
VSAHKSLGTARGLARCSDISGIEDKPEVTLIAPN